MEIRFRMGVRAEVYHRAIAKLGTAAKRVAEVRLLTLRDGISIDMFASDSLPYQATKTYRAIMNEFNYRRTQVQIEARRDLLRGM